MPRNESPGHGTKAGSPAEEREKPASRQDFSTLVSGGVASGTTPRADLSSAAAPPRPLQITTDHGTDSGRVRPSSFAEGVRLAEDFEDDTPASRSILLAEQVGPLPPSSAGSVRMSLTGSGRNLRGVRVALVDIDPTRTDALAVALRARQAEVHVSNLEADRVHMRLLRRFSPHAVLIDEEVLASIGRGFVEKLRVDPFLGHTQLFTLRFERMYKKRVGVASIETVREFLEPLGRAENELLARLGPHVEVEFELDQFPPHRLLKMLATRPAPTTIQCTREKEMLRWTVVRGRTGHAQLYRLGVEEPERLDADEALEWILGHQNCHVVLTQPTEFDDKTGREVIPMVERQESGLWAMPSPGFARRSKSAADSLSPLALRRRIRRARSADKSSRPPPGKWKRLPWWKFPVAAGLGAVLAIFLSRAGAFRLVDEAPSVAAGQMAVAVVDADAEEVRPQVPSAASTSGGPNEARTGVALDSAEPRREAREEEASNQKVETELPHGGLFAVPPQRQSSCRELVGDFSAPPSVTSEAQLGRLSNQYFRAAQKALVGGQNEKAHADLCRAALLHPAGQGTLLLVQFVLSRRDYEQAMDWMKQVRDARPGELEVEELWGDVLHQAGRQDEALRVWLAALSMNSEETAKRSAVARRWIAHSERSLAGGDYPRAERALRRAHSFDPNSALSARYLSTVFERQGHADAAKRWRAEEARLVELK